MAQYQGTPGDDRLRGRSADDVMKGLNGNDFLLGRGGDDLIYGGGGDDVLVGGAGEDALYGGAGRDVLKGGTRADESGGISPIDTLDGGAGDDRIYGGYGRDTLTGGDGADRFTYRATDDARVGEGERILDFQEGVDMLVFRNDLRSTERPLHFIGSEAFSGTPGEVRFDAGSENSTVQVDLNGDTQIDMVIGFAGVIQFQASDFSF